jgi:hypothetical protein
VTGYRPLTQGITVPLHTNTDLSRKECRPLTQGITDLSRKEYRPLTQGITDPLHTNTDLSRKECRPLKQDVPKNCLQTREFPADGLVSLLFVFVFNVLLLQKRGKD